MIDANLIFGTMPIGNLDDVTYNLINYIQKADIIAVENEKCIKEIVDHYGLSINAEIISISPLNFMSNGITSDKSGLIESRNTINNKILENINLGKMVLCVSDEGSPIVVDPFNLVRQLAISKNIPYKILSGPSSIISSISCSKLYDGESFCFYGMLFYDQNKAYIYNSIKESFYPSVVFYHHEIQDIFFKELLHHLGPDRSVTLVSNLTSKNEFVLDGSIDDIINFVSKNDVRQPTLVIAGKGK